MASDNPGIQESGVWHVIDYRVVMVGEADLPEGVDWAVGQLDGGDMIAFLKVAHICPDVLQEAWAAAVEVGLPLRQGADAA